MNDQADTEDLTPPQLTEAAILAHMEVLPKSLEPKDREAVIQLRANPNANVAQAALLATAHLLAGKPTVTVWNGYGADGIAQRLEAAKPVLLAAIDAVQAPHGDTTRDTAPETETSPEVEPEAKTATASSPPDPEAAPDPDAEADPDSDPELEAETDTAPVTASGVIPVFLLDAPKLAPNGSVVRISRRKLADLELVQDTHWRPPTPRELALAGQGG